VSRNKAPRNLTPAERREPAQKLADLNEMLPEPEDEPHFVAAVDRLLRQYGQK
jgi:hypothetical protein